MTAEEWTITTLWQTLFKCNNSLEQQILSRYPFVYLVFKNTASIIQLNSYLISQVVEIIYNKLKWEEKEMNECGKWFT